MKIKIIMSIMCSHEYHEFQEYSYSRKFINGCLHFACLTIVFAIFLIATFPTAHAQGNDSAEVFPSWFKQLSKLWIDGIITAPDFVTSSEYLINQKLIPITISESKTSTISNIPQWLKNNVKWWTQDILSNDELIKNLEFLVDNGIIKKTQREPYSLFYHFTMDKTETQDGETITWTSKDYISHTLTRGTPSDNVQSFTSSVIQRGEKISHTFQDGTYYFFCMIHPWETSTLTIPSNLEDYQKPILSFVDSDKDPYYYLERYLTELEYKNWFDANYQYYTIYESVGLSESDYLEFVKDKKEKAAIIAQKIREESGELTEYEAQMIVRDFESASLSIVEFSNHDWKIIFDYMEEFFKKHKEKFDPELIRTISLIGYNSPSNTLDMMLDDAGVTNQFYTGYSDNLKKIFKTKLRQIDDLYDQSVNKINDLDIEIPKKEYYIRELDKNKDEIRALHLIMATTILQPMDEKIRISEDKKSIRSEIENYSNESGGGCLIATAAYGTELAPQVQLLREIRDNQLLNTESGSVFMSTFNQFYYSFSPIIADYERENPLFQQTVRAFITPMISSLPIMTLADGNSESEVLGFGISVIALNLGLYVITPVVAIYKIGLSIKKSNIFSKMIKDILNMTSLVFLNFRI